MANTQTLLATAGTCMEVGDLSGAAALYREVLAQQPAEPQALMMLGLIARQMGRLELALQLMETAKASAPNSVPIWINYAVILRQLDRHAEARQAAEKALQLDPQSPDALDTAGYMAREDGAVGLACERHKQAVKLAPENARLRANYAVALLRNMQLQAAHVEITEALRLDPQLALAHMTMACVLRAAGYPARAIPYFRRAYELYPDYIDAYTNEAQAHLIMGDWETGWRCLEKRVYNAARFASLPRWQGEKVTRLLVHAEQGFGDALQFLRWLPLMRDRAEHITLQVPQALCRLVEKALPDIPLINPDDVLPVADAHVPLMSLPHILKAQVDNVPPPMIVEADEVEREVWRTRLQNVAQPRIGVVWAGNPLHPNDHNRSLKQSEIEPLLTAFGSHCVVMQSDGAFLYQQEVIGKPKDFADTGGLLAELDLIITVDTSIAHLAGMMGRPTWLLLPFDPDWRWFYEREDSIWYSSMRLFREVRPQNFVSVIAQVIAELQKLRAGDRQVLIAKKWLKSLVSEHPEALTLT